MSITVKAAQEQQAQIKILQKQNVALVNINAAIFKRLETLENRIRIVTSINLIHKCIHSFRVLVLNAVF